VLFSGPEQILLLSLEHRYSVVVLDKPGRIFDGINTARIMFKVCKFDKIKCSEKLNILKNYKI
jgi:hypothetical protein